LLVSCQNPDLYISISESSNAFWHTLKLFKQTTSDSSQIQVLLLIGWGANKRQYSQAREKAVIIKSLQNALTDQNSHVQPIRAATLISTNY